MTPTRLLALFNQADRQLNQAMLDLAAMAGYALDWHLDHPARSLALTTLYLYAATSGLL